MPSSFVRLIHADWSTHPRKRWMVEAERSETGWTVKAPRLVGPIDSFVADLVDGPQSTLAGFDFPIGLPSKFGQMTEFGGFCDAIDSFGIGKWSRFFEVGERAEDISLYRPFYPRVPSSLAKQSHLLGALGVREIDALRRQCERATNDRRAACALFWTLGGNQVGKAAISGWREVVQPARKVGARLWPFEGSLFQLAEAQSLVICETYPAEAYGHVDVRFGTRGSKQRQEDRRAAASNLALRCDTFGLHLTEPMRHALADGFGPQKDGEDAFDAAIGLFGMIEVVEGRRVAAPAEGSTHDWEGWILGQAAG